MAYFAFSVCLSMLMLACMGSCAVLSSHTKVNVAKGHELPGAQKASGLNGIKLPQFLAIGIKYSFAGSWTIKSPYMKQEKDRFCDKNQLEKIKVCGTEQLYTAIAGGFSKRTVGQSKLTSGDFTKKLENLCREYDQYKRCLRESSVDQCEANEKSVVGVLYSYMCSDGKKHLMTFDTGMCLSNLKMASVAKVVKATPGCEYYFSDMSTALQAMFSAFHDHDKDAANEAVAIRENLVMLCRYWKTLEKCLLPSYGKFCGKSAELFYVGLIDKIKAILADTFKSYGSDLDAIAKCSQKTGEKAASVLRSGSSGNWLFRYVGSQLNEYTTFEIQQQLRCGQCSPLTTSFSLMACFWQVAYDIGTRLIDVLNRLPRDPDEMFRLMKLFQTCYDGRVSACPANSKVDFSGLIHDFGIIKGLNTSCFEALADIKSSTRCGSTLSEIAEYYLFRGSRIYILDQISCNDQTLIPSKLDLSCFDQSINSVAREPGAESCVPYLRKAVQSLKSIVEQHSALFGRARDAMCNRNCGLQ